MARFPPDTKEMVRKYSEADVVVETGLAPSLFAAVGDAASRVSTGNHFDALDAIFFTIASTSFRSLSFRFAE